MTTPASITRHESFLSTMLAPVRIDPDTGETTARGVASGFFWEADGRWYLITNLHVITGWHYEENRPLSSKAFCPTHIEFQLAIDALEEPDRQARVKLIGRVGKCVALAEDEEPVWLEHPELGSKVDVAAVPLFDCPGEDDLRELGVRGILSAPVNTHPEWTPFYKPHVADDAYVVGYPKGMSARGFPIWKRASIASEPNLDVDKLPKILIDTATREGMSGSPVIAVHRGFCSPTGRITADTVMGEVARFLGVYSGRIGDDPFGLQLGIVWKARVIDEIIDGSTKGTWPWDQTSAAEFA